MGAACTSSHKGDGEHNLNIAVEYATAVPRSEKDELDGSVASVSTHSGDEPDVSLASGSTHSGDEPDVSLATGSTSSLLILNSSSPEPASAAESQSFDDGEHTLRWIDGASYTGSLKDGKMQGYGTWTSADGHTTYAGEWLDDRWHGKGELVSEVGTYDGEFRKGSFDGTGVMRWTDQRYYEGEWKQGKRHGYGLNVGKLGQQRVGYWKQNRFVSIEKRGC